MRSHIFQSKRLKKDSEEAEEVSKEEKDDGDGDGDDERDGGPW